MKSKNKLRVCDPIVLPGFNESLGKEFFFIEVQSESVLRETFSRIVREYEGPMPNSGGIMNENALVSFAVTATEDLVLFCVSANGDIDGWRNVVEQFVKNHSLRTASISPAGVQITGESEIVPWSSCIAMSDRPIGATR